MRFPIICTAFILLASAALAAPVITGVTNGASYQPTIASATWAAITGSNLASTTRQWGDRDFLNGNLPTKLDDVQVTVNGRPAYVYFISPGQINILAPDDAATGQVPVQVTNLQGASNAFMVNKQAAAPALFAYSGGRYAIVQAASTYELIAPPGLIAVPTALAAPGESIVLYATGLGPATPAQPSGQLVPAPAPVASRVTVTIGNQPATVQFAGIVGSGLYQINVAVPAVPPGDAPIVVSVNGAQSAQASLPIQAPPGLVGRQTAPALSGCLSGQVDYITYSVNRLPFNLPDEASIGGTRICATCAVKAPLYGDFAARIESWMERRKPVQACYDANGTIFQVRLRQP